MLYSAERLIGSLVGVSRGLRISVFLLAIIFTGIEFDDIVLGVALNLEGLQGVALGLVWGRRCHSAASCSHSARSWRRPR